MTCEAGIIQLVKDHQIFKDISYCQLYHHMLIENGKPNRLRRTNSTSRAEDIVTEDAKVANAIKLHDEKSACKL